MTARVQHLEWKLRAAPAKLWPYVADTDRLNNALGLPAVTFTDEQSPQGWRRFGEFSYLGLKIRWEEKPFEWIENEQLGVERLYENGPIKRLRSFVRLAPDGGGTLLQHSLEYESRGLVGAPVAELEFVLRVPRNLERVYRSIDAHLAGEAGSPFPGSTWRFSVRQEAKLDFVRKRLTRAEGWPVALVDKLVEHLKKADDLELTRLRPFELADRWGVDRATVLRAFVRAASLGMLVLGWDIVCPACRGARLRLDELRALGAEAHCATCDVRIDTRADRALELVFTPNPALRPVGNRTYCVGGPGKTPHIVLQRRLAPGERVRLGAHLVPGAYRVRGPSVTRPALVEVAAGSPAGVAFSLSGDVVVPETALGSPALELELANGTDRERLLLLERTKWLEDAVTPGHAFACGELTTAFPAQLPPASLGVSGGNLALLAVGIELAPEGGDLEPDERAWIEADLGRVIDETVRAHRGGLGAIERPLPPRTRVLLFADARQAFEAAGALLAAIPVHARQRDLPAASVRAALDSSPCFVWSGGTRPVARGAAAENLGGLLEIAAAGELIVGAQLANDLGEPPESLLRCSAGRGHVRFATALKLPPRAPGSGLRLDELDVAGEVGKGRHSRVHVAQHRKDGRRFAVKFLPEKQVRSRARFDREISALARLRGLPNVVAAHGHGEVKGELWIALDLVAGATLEKRIKERGRSTPAEAAALMAPVARALHAAHGRGILHRDVKPANIVIAEGDVPWLIDFGVAALGVEDRPKPGTISGTFPYLAPEAFDPEPTLDVRSDVYALGVTFFELVSGQRPFGDASGDELIVKILSESAPALGGGDDAARVARHALRKRREDRYSSAAEIATDLDLLAQGKEPVFAPPLEEAGEQTKTFGTRLFRRALDAIRGKKSEDNKERT